MKRLMLVIFFSCGIAWLLLNHFFGENLNPNRFAKSAAEAKQIIEALDNN